MKINVMISDDKTITLDVDPNESIENVKALLEVQANVKLPQQRLFYNNSEIKNSETLRGLGVKNWDLLTLVSKNSSVLRGRDLSLNPYGSAVNQLHRDSSRMAQLFERDPEFAHALSGNDLDKIEDILRSRHRQRQDVEAEKKIEPAIQKRIDEKWAAAAEFHPQGRQVQIQQKRIDEKWAAAVEYHPQGISQEIMLYVDMEVNGVPVKAFVDSGAGASAISWSFAARCGLRLDHNYRGIAVGVGQTEVVARIHCAPIKIGSNYYHCPFIVFLISNTEVILGLDMLRRHKCNIDLQDNTLKLEGGKFSVPFLKEKDMPSGFLRVMSLP